MKALFVDVNDIKKKSIISGNVDADKMLQFVEVAQDTHIQNYLGGKLYKKIQQLIIDDEISNAGNENYKYILETYIQPMLIWFTQATYIPFSLYTINNGGMYKHISENGQLVDKDEMLMIEQKCKDTADFYTRRFVDYMCRNSNQFPEYTTNHEEDMHPDRDVNYRGGWYV